MLPLVKNLGDFFFIFMKEVFSPKLHLFYPKYSKMVLLRNITIKKLSLYLSLSVCVCVCVCVYIYIYIVNIYYSSSFNVN